MTEERSTEVNPPSDASVWREISSDMEKAVSDAFSLGFSQGLARGQRLGYLNAYHRMLTIFPTRNTATVRRLVRELRPPEDSSSSSSPV